MIDPALLNKVQQRAIVYTALFVLSIASLIFAIVVQDGSAVVKVAGFFGGIGTIVFGLMSSSECGSYQTALRGEPPYAE